MFLLVKYVMAIKVQSCCFFICLIFNIIIAISGYLAGWCVVSSLPSGVIGISVPAWGQQFNRCSFPKL